MFGRTFEVKKEGLSFVLVIVPGMLAYTVSCLFPVFDALFLSLLFGIIAGSVFRGEQIKISAERALSIALPAGIVLYGFRVRIPAPSQIPVEIIALTTFSAMIMSFFVYVFSRLLKVEKKLSVLLACGTAICGASAITILSSIVKPRKDEFSASILTITVVGLTGVIFYPAIWHILSLSAKEYAALCGATLHQTGLVEAATRPFGENMMREALSVKGIRITLISVAALAASMKYSEGFYVPWYIFAFLVISVLSSFMIPQQAVKFMEPLSTLAFSVTLASIGVSVRVSEVQRVGIRPLLASYTGWAFALSLFLLALKSTGF